MSIIDPAARPPLPPFTLETATLKVQKAEDAWNSRDPDRCAAAYTEDSVWRNRSDFFSGREAIRAFLQRKWEKELDYRLRRELWAFTGNRISVRFEYEWHDAAGARRASTTWASTRRIASSAGREAEFNQPTTRSNNVNRNDVTEMIIEAKVKKGITWESVAKKVGLSKEWVTAGCLGQMTFDAKQAKIIAKTFGLPPEAEKWLQEVPYKGSLPTAVPTDPLIYRFYELISVYGTTFKALIHEEFGDGIMSAIDFKMDMKREANPNGDRVNIVMSGKFLPYKTY